VLGRVSHVTDAMRLVFARRGYRLLFGLLFAGFLAFYAVALPAAYTGGRMGWISLRFLTPTLGLFALLLSALVALSLTFSAYGFRQAASLTQGSGAVSIVLSLLPSLLCCTPVVPTALALLGASATTIFTVGGRIQGIFATYEFHFLSAAALLLLYAVHRGARQLQASCPIAG